MENATLRFWADLSTVYLLTVVFIFGLIPAVIAYFAVRGMSVVNRKASPFLKLIAYYIGIARGQAEKYSYKAAMPLARGHAQGARVGGIWRGLQPSQDQAKQEEKQP